MKHNLKPKYKWRDRESHFRSLEMKRRWDKILLARFKTPNYFERLLKNEMSFGNPSDSLDQVGDSALEGGPDTTNSGKYNKINIKQTIRRGKK